MKHRRRIPLIEQHQKTECGLCCVAMISSYYKHDISTHELHEIYETGRDGTSFLQLTSLLQKIGFSTKAFKFPPGEGIIDKIITPAIALWDECHFVIVERVRHNKVYIIDPETGRDYLSADEFMQHFSNYLVSVVSAENVRLKKNKSEASEVYKIIFGSWKSFLTLLPISLMCYGVSFVLPVAVGRVIDIMSNGDELSFEMAAIVLLASSLLYFVILLLQKVISIKLSADIDIRLKKRIIQHMFNIPYKFYANRSKGDLIYSVEGLTRIRDLFVNQFIVGLLDLGLVVCVFIYMGYIDIVILMNSIVLVLLNLGVLLSTRNEIDYKSKRMFRSHNEMQNKEVEIIYSMFGIKMEGFEENTHAQWKEKHDSYIKKYINSQIYSGGVLTVSQMLTFLSPFIVVFFAVNRMDEMTHMVGTIFTLFSLASLLFGKTQSIFDVAMGFLQSRSFITRANEILRVEREQNGWRRCSIRGNVSLKNVMFSYTKDSAPVLKDINMEIKAGDKIAIVGPSGAGKSTLASLLIGLYEATGGEIYFDGQNGKEFDKKILRRQIGVVPQNMTLFNKSVIENVIGDNIDICYNQVVQACKMANIHDEIMNMPMQYNTIISEMGLNLSGGQRQRIVLARAIVKNPQIVLLDEATSYLDNINEAKIMQGFKDRKITTIVIAHRLSTIIDADKIVVLDRGRIKEMGRHKELINLKNGIYRKMYKAEEMKACNY